jgi:hypothetical protein
MCGSLVKLRVTKDVSCARVEPIVTFTSGIAHDIDGPVWLLVKPAVSTVIVWEAFQPQRRKKPNFTGSRTCSKCGTAWRYVLPLWSFNGAIKRAVTGDQDYSVRKLGVVIAVASCIPLSNRTPPLVHKIRQAPETHDCPWAFPFQPLHVPKLEEQISRTKPIFDAYSGVQMIMFLENVLCLIACVLKHMLPRSSERLLRGDI